MKKHSLFFAIVTLLCSGLLQGQLSFTLTPSLCVGGITNVTATTGTLTAIQYSWAAQPTGPVFSASTSSATSITFPAAGTYTIAVGILTGSGFAYATNTIVINPLPSLSIAPSSASVCPGFSSTLTAFGATTYTWTGTNISPPVTQQSVAVGAGSYTVSGTSAGCSSSASISIGIGSNLNIIVSQTSATTCITSNFPQFSKVVVLSASGAGSYTWFPINPVVTNFSLAVRPLSTTCYTVLGSTAVCSGSAVSCVTVIPQFTMNVLPATVTMCAGETHSLQIADVSAFAGGPVSAWTYNWMEALNAPPISISSYITPTVNVFPQNSTTYTAEVKDSRDCVSLPAFAQIVVNPCTGIKKINAEEFFATYPNPVKSHLTLNSGLSGTFVMCVTDLLGKKLLEETLILEANSAKTMNLQDLPAGVYLFKVSQAGQTLLNRKLMKE